MADSANKLDVNKVAKAEMLTYGLSSLGFALGLFYAYKQKTHFWGYLGFGILGSIGGGAIGNVVSSTSNFTD